MQPTELMLFLLHDLFKWNEPKNICKMLLFARVFNNIIHWWCISNLVLTLNAIFEIALIWLPMSYSLKRSIQTTIFEKLHYLFILMAPAEKSIRIDCDLLLSLLLPFTCPQSHFHLYVRTKRTYMPHTYLAIPNVPNSTRMCSHATIRMYMLRRLHINSYFAIFFGWNCTLPGRARIIICLSNGFCVCISSMSYAQYIQMPPALLRTVVVLYGTVDRLTTPMYFRKQDLIYILMAKFRMRRRKK